MLKNKASARSAKSVRRSPGKDAQEGVTLIEVVAGLGVLSLMLTGLAILVNNHMEDIRAQQVSQHQSHLIKAINEWMAVPLNRERIVTNATVTAPVVLDPTVDLQPYLPANFSTRNSFNQDTCVRAYFDNTTQRIEIAVSTSGGAPLNDGLLGYAVAHAGPGAGGVYSTAPTEARGAYGNWVAPVANYGGGGCPMPTEGHLLSLVPFDNSGTAHLGGAGQWLSRMEVPGRPELNRMSTAIDMNEYDINRILNAEVLESVFVGENVFAQGNINAAGDITSQQTIYANENVGAGNNVVAQNHMISTSGSMYATEGVMVARDAITTNYASSSGASVKTSEAITYGTLAAVGSVVPAPMCGTGTPQIFVTPAAFGGTGTSFAGGAYAYATGSGPWVVRMQVLAVTPVAEVTGTDLSIGFDGQWIDAPAGSLVSVTTKCSQT